MPEEEVTLTLREAAQVLDPPFTTYQLRLIVRALHWKPAGYRHTGRAGKPTAAYSAARILRLHAALLPFAEKRGTLWACDASAQIVTGHPAAAHLGR